ncbi:MAG: DUF998 domain-containing protein [Solirubrobacteraceae bacterium]
MRRLELTVFGGLVAFVGLVALQHPLRGDLPPADHFISEYAHGSTAALQIAAFVAWAISLAAGALLARHAAPGGRGLARALAVGGLAVAAAGIVVASAFATQTVAGVLPEGVARTTGGRLHDFGTLATLVGLLLAAAASLRLVARRGFRVTVGLLAASLLLIVPLLVALGIDAPGIGQRGFLLVGCAFQWRFAREIAHRSG